MQTLFSPDSLKNPAMAASEKILRSCVHCGFCTATCPTYLLLGDELDSPRGRIYLIKDMFENGRPATREVVQHVDRCLSCLSCMTTCPSGVHYMHLVDHARSHIEKTYQRDWSDRLLRWVLASILPYPARFRWALRAAALARPFASLVKTLPAIGPRLAAMLELAPQALPDQNRPDQKSPIQSLPVAAEKRGRVAVLQGCAQPVLNPGINEAAMRLLARMGVEIVDVKGQGCCGALVHHMGREDQAHAQAKASIDAFMVEIDKGGLDAIVITASGCGTTVKDYGFMFRDDPAYADKAQKIASLAKDITEVVTQFGLPPTKETPDLVVAYHSACSMQHGQQIRDEPKKLLKQAGFVLRDVPEGHICCGSAGTYNLLQPEIAGRLRARKVGNIMKMRPEVVATGNLGCMTQIGKGITDEGQTLPVLHSVELLDWATGGPVPASLVPLLQSKSHHSA
jgi:glycolate oxidase iron-sulfur subunit